MEERSFYRAVKKVNKVCVSIWLLWFFIVNFNCSTKEGVRRIRNDTFTGCESLVPDLRGGCISFFPSWPLRSLRRGFFYAHIFSTFFFARIGEFCMPWLLKSETSLLLHISIPVLHSCKNML